MKKTINISLLIFLLSSCSEGILKSKKTKDSQKDKELGRLYKIFDNYDYDLFVNYNSGSIPSIMGGIDIFDVSVQFLDEKYEFPKGEQKKYEIPALATENGRQMPVVIKSSYSEETFDIYVPQLLKIDQNLFEVGKVNRKGTLITWNKDEENTLGVLVSISVYDFPFGGKGKTLLSESFVIDDTGELLLDEFLSDPSAKTMDIFIKRGNAVKHMIKDKKLVFYLISNGGYPMIDIE